MSGDVWRRAVHSLDTRPYLRFALLATIAVGVAAGLGRTSEHISGMVAAVTAVTVLQPTLHRSLREVFWQIVGVGLGIVAALVVAATVGFGTVSLSVAVFSVFLFCRAVRLPLESAIGVVVPTILIIGGNSFTVDAVETRIFGVLLGGAVAVVLSYVARPGTPTVRALRGAADESRDAAEVLAEVAAGLSGEGVSRGDVEVWKAAMVGVESRLAELRADAEDAVKGSRWSPMLPKSEAVAVLEQVKVAQGSARAVAEMVAAVGVAVGDGGGGIPGPVGAALAEMLRGTAGLIEEQAAESEHGRGAARLGPDVDVVRQARRGRRLSADRVKTSEDTTPLLLGGSLVADSHRIETLLAEPAAVDAGGATSPGAKTATQDHPNS